MYVYIHVKSSPQIIPNPSQLSQYKDPDVVSKVKSVTGNTLHIGFDTVSAKESQILSVKMYAPGTGKLHVILYPDSEAQKLREDVQFSGTSKPS